MDTEVDTELPLMCIVKNTFRKGNKKLKVQNLTFLKLQTVLGKFKQSKQWFYHL